ncbi:MAG: glycosyltransferase family 1 protein [Chthoniobacterales bacterium]
MAQTIHLYDIRPNDTPRWIPGDQYPRKFARFLLRPWRGRPPGGLAKVTQNLCLGMEKIKQPYRLHTRADAPKDDYPLGILHGPIDLVRKLAEKRRCVTGVGVIEYPDQWPNLFKETRSAFHLQACEWAAAYYRPYFGEHVRIWPVGIDTDTCAPQPGVKKEFDFLVYNKLRWPQESSEPNLREQCLDTLKQRGLSFFEIGYGRYPKGQENSFHALLSRSKAMLFLCENETQGIAYNEALSMNVPLLAWNPGKWLDPGRHMHGLSDWPATSVPYWDERCGDQFHTGSEFPAALGLFLEKMNAEKYSPRDYVLENLTLEICTRQYLALLEEAAAT